jgi:hypothetical protein
MLVDTVSLDLNKGYTLLLEKSYLDLLFFFLYRHVKCVYDFFLSNEMRRRNSNGEIKRVVMGNVDNKFITDVFKLECTLETIVS